MGLLVTINSDDPPLFNTDLTNEYTILIDEFGYTLVDVARIARNAFIAAFMPQTLRSHLLSEFDTWVQTNISSTLTSVQQAATPQSQ